MGLLTKSPSVSPLALTSTTFPKVQTVIDASLLSAADTLFAVHANSSSTTAFIKGSDIVQYIKSLETDAAKVSELDLAALTTGAPAAPKSKPAPKEKEDAKIEGAVQVAIGVKKEVDFATWYTNVSYCQDAVHHVC